MKKRAQQALMAGLVLERTKDRAMSRKYAGNGQRRTRTPIASGCSATETGVLTQHGISIKWTRFVMRRADLWAAPVNLVPLLPFVSQRRSQRSAPCNPVSGSNPFRGQYNTTHPPQTGGVESCPGHLTQWHQCLLACVSDAH